MALIGNIAKKYIENNKKYFLEKYYKRHKEGAVLLLFNKDGSFYSDHFRTKAEISESPDLPVNAYSEAKEYWNKYPNQLVFMSWFNPITGGVPFNVYALGTIAVENPLSQLHQQSQNKSQYTSKTDCFIVTATFDTPDAKEVHRYRQFRDKYLVKNKLGRLFIRAYYYIGPWLATFVRANLLVKRGLQKILRIISRILPVD